MGVKHHRGTTIARRQWEDTMREAPEKGPPAFWTNDWAPDGNPRWRPPPQGKRPKKRGR